MFICTYIYTTCKEGPHLKIVLVIILALKFITLQASGAVSPKRRSALATALGLVC